MLDINVTLGETAAASDRALANNGASELNGCLETRYLNLRKEIEPVPSLAIVPDSYSSGVLFSQLPSHRTNFITNNTMQGAAPNVFPNGWSTSTGTLTATCIDSGVENDIEYIDIQVSGTATSGFLNIRPNLTPSGIPAAVNDNFCGSIYYKLVSGTFPNPPNLQIQELNNSSFLSGSTVNTPATSTLTRVEVNRTMNQPTVNNVGIRWGHDANGTFNYVVRLGLPQLERGLKARDIIRTKGTLVSVYQSPTNIITQGGDFIVSRNTGATRVGPNGLIETGNTNLALQSEAWNVSPWVATSGVQGATVSGNVTTSPDGTTNADKLIEAAVSGTHFCLQSLTLTSGTTYTASFFVKASERTRGRFRMSGLSAYWDLEFNLTSATVTGATNSFIQNYGNGWYRIGATFTANQASNSFIVFIFDASGNVSYTGDGTSGFFVWGAQIEVGSTASEYIPTTTVARTRFAGVTVDGTIAANIPRIDWLGQSCPGLLVEPSGTNLTKYSEQFNTVTSGWSPSNLETIASNVTATLDPAGGNTADLIVATTTSGVSHKIFSNTNNFPSFVSGTAYTLSVFAKATSTTSGFVQIAMGGNDFSPALPFANFQLSGNGAVTTGTYSAATIQSFGNGWYRCSLTATAVASGTAYTGLFVPILASGTARDGNFTGNGVDGVYLWGAQVETGSVATTYIPTTTGAVSRAADVISASGALVSGLIGQTEGTLYVECESNNGSDDVFFINRSINNGISLYKNANNSYLGRIFHSSSSIIFTSVSGITGMVKIAVAYKSGDSTMYLNGSRVGTLNTSAITFSAALNSLVVEKTGFISGATPSRIRAVALYTTRLSDDQLAELTRL